MKKLIILLIICLSSVYLNAQNHSKPVGLKFIGDALVGNNPHHFYTGPAVNYADAPGPIIYSKIDYVITLQEVSPYARTYYDFQSNAVTRYIWQEQGNSNYIHAIFMSDSIGNSGFPDRKTKYFFTSNGGTNWSYIATVPNGIRSGFPYITLMNDGRELIMNHSTAGGGDLRTQLFINTTSGGSTFTRLDPGLSQSQGLSQPEWPAGVSTSNDKVVFLSSQQVGNDTAFRNVCTNLSGSGTFSGYIPIIDMGTANCYSAARSGNKVGIAYITGVLSSYPNGSVFYIESTDNGSTWGSPVQVWLSNFIYSPSFGALRSVDLTFQGIYPKVIFGLATLDEYGSYYPNSPSKIMLWSPNINGGNPVTIDSADGLNGGNPIGDVFVSDARGVIGTSADGLALYTAWCRSRLDTDDIGDNYFDIYFSYSIDGGLTWEPAIQVTNNSGPLRDCRYVTISPSNHNVASSYFANLIYQSDSIPGSFVNGAEQSLARMMYAKLDLGSIFAGIHTINSELPKSFALSQNYPNPFNPKTLINFQLPKISNVKLIIYDVLGREISILVNGQMKPGVYQVEWDGSNYPSGVYFYKLISGEFVETKKMVLIK